MKPTSVAVAIFAVAASHAFAADTRPTSATLRPIVDKALERFAGPGYEHGIVALHVADAETSEVLVEHNSSKAIMPASIVKAVTTAASLHHFSPDDRFETRLEAGGTTSAQGVLSGDLIIRGGGDPTLGSTRAPDSASSIALVQKWADAVRAAEISQVQGRIVADESFFATDPIPDGWAWADIGNGYGTGTSGLSFHDNVYFLYFLPAATVGDPAPISCTEPTLPELLWYNEMRTGPVGSGDQGYIYGAPLPGPRWARGTIPQGAPEFMIKGSLPDPGVALARLLRDALTSAGISVQGEIVSTAADAILSTTLPRNATLLDVHQSPPLSAIVHILNKHSQNLYAETLLLHLARKTGKGTRGAALNEILAFWRGLGADLGGVALYDGSGLSRIDRVTARAMVALCLGMRHEPHFKLWHDSLPVLGVDADLRHRARDTAIQGKVHAKTGYIGGPSSRTLSGYLEGKSGRLYCFAFLLNGHTVRLREADTAVDATLLDLHNAL